MNAFLTACGATAPLSLEIEGPDLVVGGRRQYAQPFVLIGRDERCGLLLDHDAVSRRHAYAQVIDGHVFVVDLDSRSGTVIGDRPVENGWITSDRALLIGPYGLRFAAPGGDAAPVGNPLRARGAGASRLPEVSLEFQSHSAGHSVWRMNPVLALLGSSPRCNVRLSDADVSKFHFALLRTPAGLWAVDLLGRGGISVNGAAVRASLLGPGDVLGLGRVIVRSHLVDASPPTDTGAGLPELRASTWHPPAPAGQADGASTSLVPARFASDQLPAAADPSLSLLLNHFGQMQQQMLDQFQQSMMMMMQMFGGMHRDQMGLVREEIDKLGELKKEVAAIKAEMASRPSPAAPAPYPPPIVPPPWRPAGQPAPAAPPARSEPRHSNGHAPGGSPPPPSFPPRPERREPDPPVDVDAGPSKSPAPPPDLSGDTHDWLNRRLAMIEAEQQNRWQKIMGYLKGDR